MYTVDLFADSFGDVRQKYLHQPHRTWVDLLSDHYEIKNFSLTGTGAHYHVQKLMNIERHSDFLLFMMPDINRLSLSYIVDNFQATTNLIFKQKQTGTFDPNYWQFKENKHLIDSADQIFRDYEGFYNAQLHKILEPLIVQYVFSKSHIYEKILVWCSSGQGYPFTYNNSLIIPENCHIVKGSLHIISDNEPGNKTRRQFINKDTGKVEINHKPVLDDRNNHLCEDNHRFLAESIHDYFEYGTLPDVSKLLEDQSNQRQDFIYD